MQIYNNFTPRPLRSRRGRHRSILADQVHGLLRGLEVDNEGRTLGPIGIADFPRKTVRSAEPFLPPSPALKSSSRQPILKENVLAL